MLAASSSQHVARTRTLSAGYLAPYKICTGISYTALVVTAIYYSFCELGGTLPDDHRSGHSQSSLFFDPNPAITLTAALFISQAVYVASVWSTKDATPLATVGCAHFIASELLLSGFAHLWMHDYLWLSEALLVVNFFNLSFAYFCNSHCLRLVHFGPIVGPLVWNFTALYWMGAKAVDSSRFAAHVVANASMWGWLGYGLFYLAAYKDYIFGIGLSMLSLSTGFGQYVSGSPSAYLHKATALTVGGILSATSLAVIIYDLCSQYDALDCEKAPLLHSEPHIQNKDDDTSPLE
ncbi:hypothetical protein E8E12_000716 [Didymella heteroderae]|uniref:DUF1774-domain-containing protein n=1 Tax=Didymella heteroderae TaxID=1769908 RepID=A0A9P5BV32_9PLEO|nr:hypothetical protein E8E12_000716 [Didymella heteroderae]